MRGGTLAAVLKARGGLLSEADARVVGRNILRGLRSMHANGYAHLDVKPDNIGVAEEGDLDTLVLMDFDCAEPLGAFATLSYICLHAVANSKRLRLCLAIALSC